MTDTLLNLSVLCALTALFFFTAGALGLVPQLEGMRATVLGQLDGSRPMTFAERVAYIAISVLIAFAIGLAFTAAGLAEPIYVGM